MKKMKKYFNKCGKLLTYPQWKDNCGKIKKIL